LPCNSVGSLAFGHFALPPFICASKWKEVACRARPTGCRPEARPDRRARKRPSKQT